MAECPDLLLMETVKKQVVTKCSRQVRLTPLDSHSNTWISFNRKMETMQCLVCSVRKVTMSTAKEEAGWPRELELADSCV